MRVPKRLERATEAVLGGALQNVVTTDEYIARDMIAYLRQNKLGRATFLPMTTISGRTLSPQERPSARPRLFVSPFAAEKYAFSGGICSRRIVPRRAWCPAAA